MERRKRGRPPIDPTPNTSNPAFRRVRAAVVVENEFFYAAMQVCDGSSAAEVTDALRRDLAIMIPVGDFSPAEGESIRRRGPRVVVPPAREIFDQGGPAKWAAAMTGLVIGHGRHWYRDAVERSPWPPGKRRRFSTSDELESKRAEHPGKFDHFTNEERTFGKLPQGARAKIEGAVRLAYDEQRQQWTDAVFARGETLRSEMAKRLRRQHAIVDYFERVVAERRDLPVPMPLKRIVSRAIRELDERTRARVTQLCRRHLRGGARTYLVTPLPSLGYVEPEENPLHM